MPTPTPAQRSHAEPQVSRHAAEQAIQSLLQPLLKLALRAGLKYPELDALLRDGLLNLAPQLAANPKASHNNSQLSVLTGLHRKAVAQWREQAAKSAVEGARHEPALRSHAAKVFTLWQHEVQMNAHLRRLPIHAPYSAVPPGRGKAALPQSFAALARQVSTDVHPRSLLDELLRLGLVTEAGGEVCLQRSEFVPQRAAHDDLLALLAANARAHLSTGLNNCTEADCQPWLEQAIWADGVSLDSALHLDAEARELWAAAHRLLFAAIEAMPEAPPGEPRYRVRVGMYAHAETLSSAEEPPCTPQP